MTTIYERDRIPTRPLLDYLGADVARQLAERCGVTMRTIFRWSGGLGTNMSTAESVCDRLGIYPTEVWGEEWWAYVDCPACDRDLPLKCRCRSREKAARKAEAA